MEFRRREGQAVAHVSGRAVQEVTGQMVREEGLDCAEQAGRGGAPEGRRQGEGFGEKGGVSMSCAAEVKSGPGLGHWIQQLRSLTTGPERGWRGTGRA